MPSPTRPRRSATGRSPPCGCCSERYLIARRRSRAARRRRRCAGAWRGPSRAAECRFGRSAAGGGGGCSRLLRHDGGRSLPAQLSDPHERGQGQSAPVLGLLRPAGGRFHARDLRLGQSGGHHPPVRRRHGLRVLAPPAEERSRALDGRPRLGSRVLPAGVQRRDGSGGAGRDASGREHGDPPRGPSRHPGVHRVQARRRHHELQHLGRRHRCLHGGSGRRRGLRSRQSAHRAHDGLGCPRGTCSSASCRRRGARETRVSSSSIGSIAVRPIRCRRWG